MATARGSVVGDHPLATTAVVSVVGYALVAAAFLGVIPIPTIGHGTVVLLSDLIGVVNTVALVLLVAGFWFVRHGDVRRHRVAMLSAFALIVLFLVLYLVKVGGGFEKALVVEAGQPLSAYAGAVHAVYVAMLGVHVLLSVVSVPVVLYAVVLGLTRPVAELPGTAHPRVGRVAVAAWTLSLFLGVLTYLLLNHVYSWEPVARSMLLVAAPFPVGERLYDRLRTAPSGSEQYQGNTLEDTCPAECDARRIARVDPSRTSRPDGSSSERRRRRGGGESARSHRGRFVNPASRRSEAWGG